MDVVLSILLWILIVAGGLFLLVLLVPIRARARGAVHDGKADGSIVVGWAGVVVQLRVSPGAGAELRVLGLRVHRFGKGEARAEEERARRGKGAGWFLRNRRLLLELARRMLATLHLRGRIEGTVGLGDPADTAALGVLVSSLAPMFERLDVRLEWDWVEPVLELDGAIRSLVWPLEVAVVSLGLLARRDVRQALRAEA